MRTILRIIRRIWQLLNFINNLLTNLFFIFLVLTFIGCWIYISNTTKRHHFEKGALLLNITGVIVDKPLNHPQLDTIGYLLFKQTPDHLKENSLFDIVNKIRVAKNDRNITGIVLDLKDFIGADQPSMQYIGKALREFRHNNKPIIAVGDNYNQEQYYLASFANKIWLSPQGMVDLRGFTSNRLYYKSFLDKLKINTHVFRIGKYKSAIEPFIRNNMSSAARKVNTHWINELWQHYLSTIVTNRRINMHQVFPEAKTMLKEIRKVNGSSAQYALNNKLVDALGSRAEIEKALYKQFGWNDVDKNYHAISIYDYIVNKQSENAENIAVISTNGVIMNGRQTPSNVGSETIAKQIRYARYDPKVKAIILRVNSPGGSVSASEIIREELVATRKSGKPIIVSMGNIAASGGYWISTPANWIIANQDTITGSIGIFGIVNTIENSLSYLGIHTDGVSTSPLADVGITKPLPLEFSQIMQLNIESSYKHFITLVAKSRKKKLEQIEKIAQGRIWTGKDAKDNGLIDSLGDFDDAVIKAAELAKLKQWHIIFYQNVPTFLENIINNITNTIQTMLIKIVQTYLSESMLTISPIINIGENNLSIMNDPKNCYAFCLTCSNIY